MSVAKRKKTLDGRSGTVTDLEDEDVEAGSLLITDTTQSTSTITGALQCRGGVGISKNLNVGGALGIATVNATSTTDSTSTSTGAITTAGGVGIAKKLKVGGDTRIYSTTNYSSPTVAAFIVDGGAYVGQDLVVQGAFNPYSVTATSTVDATGISNGTGAIITNGGISAAKSIWGNTLNAASTTDSSSTSTGSIVTAGGLGVAKNITSLTLKLTGTTESAGTGQGTIITAGGIGCAKSLFLGAYLGQGIQYITRPSVATFFDTYNITSSVVVLSGGAYANGTGVALRLPAGSSSVGVTIRVIGVKGSPASGTTFGGDYFMGGQPLYVTTNSNAQNPDQIHEFDSYSYYTYIDAHDYEFTFTNIGQIADQSANQYYTWECRCIRATCTGITVKWGFCWTAASNYTTTMSFQRLGEVVHWSTTGLATHSHNGSGNNPRAVFGTSTYTVLPFSFTPFNVGDYKFASTFQTSGTYTSLYIMFGGDQTIGVQTQGGGGCASGESLGFQNYQCGTYFML